VAGTWHHHLCAWRWTLLLACHGDFNSDACRRRCLARLHKAKIIVSKKLYSISGVTWVTVLNIFFGGNNLSPVRLTGKTTDTDLLWEKNTIILLKRYGW
jgi:hypothetical protein